MSVYRVNSKLLQEGAQVLTTAGKHQYLTDEPTNAGGTDKAPNPVEYLLGALGACLSITVQDRAKSRHIHLNSFEVEVTGNLEMGGLRDPQIHNQFTDITYHVKIDTDLNPTDQSGFLEDCVAICPVHGTLEVAVPVDEN